MGTTGGNTGSATLGPLFHSGRIAVAPHNGTPAGVPYVGGAKCCFVTAVLAVRVIWVASFGSATPGRLHFMLPATRWPWVEPPANVIGTYPALTLCQDVNGKVHLLGNANGGATFDDTGAGYTDPWGMQGSVGWRGGLAVFSPDGSALPNGITYHAYLYVVRGGN